MKCLYPFSILAVILTGAVDSEAAPPASLELTQSPTSSGSVPKNTLRLVPKYTEPIRLTTSTRVIGAAAGTTLELASDTPALYVERASPTVIENLTIRWQLTSSNPSIAPPAAIVVKDADITFRNCRVEAIGNAARCPTALAATGFSNVHVENCEFIGFNFTITSSGGAKTTLTECSIRSPGHCGASVYSASTLELDRCIVTGSKYHGVRCTGGELDVQNSLIIGNDNRGIYLGNKPATGRIANNLIHSNGAGISAFGSSNVAISNNVFFANTYSGIDSRETCSLDITDNIFAENKHGFVLFDQGGSNQVTLGNNNFWSNDIDLKDYDQNDDIFAVNPKFTDTKIGQFQATIDSTTGLSPKAAIEIADVWKRWKTNQIE